MPLSKGPFILHRNCVALPIYRLLSATSHRSFTAFQVETNWTFMWHRNAVTLQFLCRKVQCGNATQLRHSMNGPLLHGEMWLARNWVCNFWHFICRDSTHKTAIAGKGLMAYISGCSFSSFFLSLSLICSTTCCTAILTSLSYRK